jgi:hypothetical protein
MYWVQFEMLWLGFLVSKLGAHPVTIAHLVPILTRLVDQNSHLKVTSSVA